jgi:Rieske Fe-S protein
VTDHPTTHSADPTGGVLARRTLIQGAALAGIGIAVVGCGSDEETPSPAASQDSSTPPKTPEESDTPTPKQTQEALAATSDVPVDGGVIVDDEVVVTQPEEGTFKGFSAICTHAGCVVSSVADGEIACACHGSRYSVVDGSVISGPAPAPLPEVAVKVKGDEVVRA